MKKNWMIYGANGYTGQLIAEEAVRRGFIPILAGRNSNEIQSLARQLQLSYKIFPCDQASSIHPNLTDISLVLHCAGPFSATSAPMLKACMTAKAHYLDITGEIGVFEKILSKSEEIKKAGIIAIPGVGFDVVPSDCLATMLKEKMPDANHLEMILKPSGPLSPGTTKTMLEGFYVGTVVRRNGKIQILSEFITSKKKFQEKIVNVVGIAWGDIASAYYSTQIPNIEIFLVTTGTNIRILKFLQKFRFFWKIPHVQKILQTLVPYFIRGPQAMLREKCDYKIFARVKNTQGDIAQLGVQTPNGYSLTVESSLAAVAIILQNTLEPGSYTPSQAFGSAFVLKLPRVQLLQ